MWWTHRAHRRSKKNGAGHHRQHERYRSGQQLTCPLGNLDDLTPGGMCVLSKEKPQVKVGQTMDLPIQSNTQTLRVKGRITRVLRTGFREYEIGVSFLGITPSLGKALGCFARFGYVDLTANASEAPSEPQTKPEPQPKQKKLQDTPAASATLTDADPYVALGVPSDASDDAIHQAYRQLARQYHPDVSPGQNTVDRFKKITESYKILKDPERRQIYDQRVTG